jgi:phage tail protein X
MALTQYITFEGDRWDTVAFKAYGSCTNDEIDRIKTANPYVTVKDVFASGVVLDIPIQEESESADSIEASLPPWKRSTTDSTDIEQSFNTLT